MSKILTFLDAGVLLSAAQQLSKLREVSLEIINDPNRVFITTKFVRLETELKCDYHGYQDQVKFYETFFQAVESFDDYNKIVPKALVVGKQFGLNAMDALHISASLLLGCDEFITTERPNSPYKNVKGVKILSLHPGT